MWIHAPNFVEAFAVLRRRLAPTASFTAGDR
jgi:hypothetical protein